MALLPAAPGLVAIRGYSGSGKSVLARALAPQLGATLLSSDLERKAGMARSTKLDAEAYGPDSRAAVYRGMFARAAPMLAAGPSVIMDATFIDPTLRRGAEGIVAKASVSSTA